MKSIDDALELRGRIFGSFELAETSTDPQQRRRLLTFAVVGAGPTGVEMAGQIAELAQRTLADEFRHIDPGEARVVLLDGAPKVLPTFGDRLSDKARRSLERQVVEVQLEAMGTDVNQYGVEVKDGDGSHRTIETMTQVWAAGVAGSPLARRGRDPAGPGAGPPPRGEGGSRRLRAPHPRCRWRCRCEGLRRDRGGAAGAGLDRRARRDAVAGGGWRVAPMPPKLEPPG